MDLAYPEKIINLTQHHKPAYQYTTTIARIEIMCNTLSIAPNAIGVNG